jgi:glycosyltransferase involved in cell wall biosynthesis
MPRRQLRVLVVNTSDAGGGAELTSWNVFRSVRRRGHRAMMVVGRKRTSDVDIVALSRDGDRSRWAQAWIAFGDRLQAIEQRIPGGRRARDCAYWTSEPLRWIELALGHEDLHYPATWRFFERQPFDIVHCFNLHGGYFDLRVLPQISRRCPVILDLCDAWLLSGHCAHSIDCEGWKTGCGACPDLTRYPAVRRDATAFNWRRKQRIFAKSRVYVTAPSQWLLQRARESMLAPAIAESRVIPTGVERSVFHPGDRGQARAALGLPHDAKVLLFVANMLRRNPYKDCQTVAEAVAAVGRRGRDDKVVLIALGEAGAPDRVGNAEIRFVPHIGRPEEVADYYRAADVYLHAARADTFPRVILEALACGIPAIATAVGGIPEQIRPLGSAAPTGLIVPPADVAAMTAAVEYLLANPSLCRAFGENAARDAADRFDLEQQVDAYMEWYERLAAAAAASPNAPSQSANAPRRPAVRPGAAGAIVADGV